MKNALFILLLLTVQMQQSIAQTKITQKNNTSTAQIIPKGTTLEEYNYMTKGIQTSFEQGLDIKRGYKLISDTSNWVVEGESNALRQIEVKTLYRDNEEVAGTLILYKRTDMYEDALFYFCIPNPYSSENIFYKALSDLNTAVDIKRSGATEIYQALTWGLMRKISLLNTK